MHWVEVVGLWLAAETRGVVFPPLLELSRGIRDKGGEEVAVHFCGAIRFGQLSSY